MTTSPWVKCSERQPPEGGEYLVVLASEPPRVAVGVWTNGVRYPLWSVGNFGVADRDVTHWMPLPELPAAEGEPR
jgi:hypothetical protein